MAQQVGELDKKTLEEALSGALRSVLGGTGSGVNPRATFHNKFQREMEEHDQDLEKKYDEDLNTTLIFAGLFSAVTSAFIIDIQSELSPDYEQMNNVLLEMLLNATTGTLPLAGSATSIPRWSGPEPAIVQAQCVFYATLCATLLAAFLAMLGKQWLTHYKRNETRGSIADRSRVRERKSTGLVAWKFHAVMESPPLILQFALLLLGFALSRYLWKVNRSVSSVVIGFTCFGFLFYSFIVTASVFSSDCTFQTPFSLMIRLGIAFVVARWRKPQKTLGPTQVPPDPELQQAQPGLPSPANATGQKHEPEASIAIQFPQPVAPLFVQEHDPEGDRLDARCIDRLFELSTDTDVIVSIMDFIPEITWHSGIKTIPLKRIYDILIGCFDFSGARPVVFPKSRDLAYLSAKAFVHIELQRRCITKYEEHDRDSWKALCAGHRILSPGECSPDSDFATALFMVDMTLGYNNGFPWKKSKMTPQHHEWMSHVFLYHAWHQEPEDAIDFVEHSVSLESPSDTVITDCFLVIGLMIGVPFNVSDILVRDKSREKRSIIDDFFRVFESIFSSKPMQIPLALRALRLATRLPRVVADCSYSLFKTIMASDDLTDQDWEAANLAAGGAFLDEPPSEIGEPKEILKFLDHHVSLEGTEGGHRTHILTALQVIIGLHCLRGINPLTSRCVREFNWASPPFVRGVRSTMQPCSLLGLRYHMVALVALVSDWWFNCSVPVMEPEGMSELCENLALLMDEFPHGLNLKRWSVTITFGMLRSPDWRKHIVPKLWSVLAYSTLAEELESVRWCLRNAIELLDFMRGLPEGEGLRWWCGTLWLHFDKLDSTTRDEVKKIAAGMRSDGLSDLNFCLGLIKGEISRVQQEVNEPRDLVEEEMFGLNLRTRLIAMEWNYQQLTQVIAGR